MRKKESPGSAGALPELGGVDPRGLGLLVSQHDPISETIPLLEGEDHSHFRHIPSPVALSSLRPQWKEQICYGIGRSRFECDRSRVECEALGGILIR